MSNSRTKRTISEVYAGDQPRIKYDSDSKRRRKNSYPYKEQKMQENIDISEKHPPSTSNEDHDSPSPSAASVKSQSSTSPKIAPYSFHTSATAYSTTPKSYSQAKKLLYKSNQALRHRSRYNQRKPESPYKPTPSFHHRQVSDIDLAPQRASHSRNEFKGVFCEAFNWSLGLNLLVWVSALILMHGIYSALFTNDYFDPFGYMKWTCCCIYNDIFGWPESACTFCTFPAYLCSIIPLLHLAVILIHFYHFCHSSKYIDIGGYRCRARVGIVSAFIREILIIQQVMDSLSLGLYSILGFAQRRRNAFYDKHMEWYYVGVNRTDSIPKNKVLKGRVGSAVVFTAFSWSLIQCFNYFIFCLFVSILFRVCAFRQTFQYIWKTPHGTAICAEFLSFWLISGWNCIIFKQNCDTIRIGDCRCRFNENYYSTPYGPIKSGRFFGRWWNKLCDKSTSWYSSASTSMKHMPKSTIESNEIPFAIAIAIVGTLIIVETLLIYYLVGKWSGADVPTWKEAAYSAMNNLGEKVQSEVEYAADATGLGDYYNYYAADYVNKYGEKAGDYYKSATSTIGEYYNYYYDN